MPSISCVELPGRPQTIAGEGRNSETAGPPPVVAPALDETPRATRAFRAAMRPGSSPGQTRQAAMRIRNSMARTSGATSPMPLA
eukprot:CAMPEP_0172907330 /NCGR_PEP_ID=MMETSP1075-20121228/178608_1 /TAXON_ID=2916 /ORGANISM="Ceratium fusus, Strain PA161109" /LENGTH=83 /DNA_ID=CAMNT_0013764923 /DNA_START=22 /DNA_END=269 /DNA_ORIENTATION=+